MIIILTDEVEQALTERARQQGTTPDSLALESLRKQFVRTRAKTPKSKIKGSLLDFLGPSIGILHSGEHVPGGAQMSTDSGKKFAEALLKRRRREQL